MIQTFSGSIGIGDMQRHIPHRFDVPEGTTRLEIRFDFTPRHPGIGPRGHEISLSLFDPRSCRGAKHNSDDQTIILTDARASLGYTPGPILPGEWCVYIDTHRLLPPGAIGYDLEVHLSDAPPGDAPLDLPAPGTAPRGPGWYRGDLHGHTNHSDARWTVEDFIAYARQIGLDFVTLSDHNTVSGIPHAKSLAGDDLLVMGGMELTTFWGHALAIGPDAWSEWRVQDGQTMADVAQIHHEAGALFIIAHPMNVGHPYCSGCTWQYLDMMPGSARVVEVWNSDWAGSSNNELGLQLYYGWLNQGHKLAASAGSDTHGPFGPNRRPGYNTVYAEDLTQEAILAAIAAGRNFISSGPQLRLRAEAMGQQAMMGDVLPMAEAQLHIDWADCPKGARLRVLGGTDQRDQIRRLAEIPAEGAGSHSLAHTPTGDWDWIGAEIRDAQGALHALANPIFFDGKARG